MGHGWFPKGQRETVPTKLGFQNFYLYTALSPKSGEDQTLILPKVNAQCMNIFLEFFSERLGDKKALMIMDRAGWHHKASLRCPDNIKIIYLPPYSPELNPVERFWEYLKDKILKNRVYESLEALRNEISLFIRLLTPEVTSSVANINYV